jgi:hypothetical protein
MYRGLAVWRPAAAAAPARLAPVSNSMDVEFAQLSDLGKVRQGNEDYLGHAAAGTPERARLGWLLPLPTAWAATTSARSLRTRRSRACSKAFRINPGRAACRTACSAWCKRRNIAWWTLATLGRLPAAFHGNHNRGLRSALRSRPSPTSAIRAAISSAARPAVLLTAITPSSTSMCASDPSQPRKRPESGTRHMLSRSLGGGSSPMWTSANTRCSWAMSSCSAPTVCTVRSPPRKWRRGGHGGDLAAAAKRLVDIANQRDGSDNISLQLIRVRSVERVGMYRGRPYRLP